MEAAESPAGASRKGSLAVKEYWSWDYLLLESSAVQAGGEEGVGSPRGLSNTDQEFYH